MQYCPDLTGNNMELRGDEKLEELINQILASPQEELIVAFGKTTETKNGLVFLVEKIGFADETYLTRSYSGLRWDAKLTAQWVKEAETSNKGVVLMHAHPFKGKAGFSSTDIATKDRILKHFGMYLQQNASGYMVVGLNDFIGDFVYNDKIYSLTTIRSVGCPVIIREKNRFSYKSSPYHHRQELAFGKEANKKLNNTVVAVVGLGGAGSMVSQQLAHLKAGKIILIDGDQLEKSNLSRVVGATSDDIGKDKTLIAERLIKTIDPGIDVIKIKDYAPTPQIYQELKTADIIISCVDKISAKIALNNFAKRYLVPLIDIGVTIRRKKDGVKSITGQVVRVLPSCRCLKCLNIISSALEKKEEIQNYGTKVKNPQVITYNGVLASLAVNEMIKLITGIGGIENSTINLSFDGLRGTIERVGTPSFVCDVCKTQYAQGDPT